MQTVSILPSFFRFTNYLPSSSLALPHTHKVNHILDNCAISMNSHTIFLLFLILFRVCRHACTQLICTLHPLSATVSFFYVYVFCLYSSVSAHMHAMHPHTTLTISLGEFFFFVYTHPCLCTCAHTCHPSTHTCPHPHWSPQSPQCESLPVLTTLMHP